MKALIDISDKDLKTLVFQPLKPLPKVNVENLIKILQQGVIIPENATNGDVIKAMFPNIKINDIDCLKMIYTGIEHKNMIGFNIDATKEWWNSPYKTESEGNE